MATLYTFGLIIWATLAQFSTSEALAAVGLMIIATVIVFNANRIAAWIGGDYDQCRWWRIWRVRRVQVGFVLAVG